MAVRPYLNLNYIPNDYAVQRTPLISDPAACLHQLGIILPGPGHDSRSLAAGDSSPSNSSTSNTAFGTGRPLYVFACSPGPSRISVFLSDLCYLTASLLEI